LRVTEGYEAILRSSKYGFVAEFILNTVNMLINIMMENSPSKLARFI